MMYHQLMLFIVQQSLFGVRIVLNQFGHMLASIHGYPLKRQGGGKLGNAAVVQLSASHWPTTWVTCAAVYPAELGLAPAMVKQSETLVRGAPVLLSGPCDTSAF